MGLMRTAWIEHPELHLPLIDRGEGETAQKALRPGSGAEGRTRMRSEIGVGVGASDAACPFVLPLFPAKPHRREHQDWQFPVVGQRSVNRAASRLPV